MISFSREQRFLVTGASSGIGRAVAQLLVALGATVLANARDPAKLETAKSASGAPEAFIVCPQDLTAPDLDFGLYVKNLRESHGKFSGFVSCAGMMYMDGLREYASAKASNVFALHLHAPVALAQAISDRRNCIGAGTSIVLVAALGGVIPQAGLLTYGAAKAALILASKNMAKELGKRRMRVNAISPALVRTSMTENDYAQQMGYDVLESEASQYPLGIGQPVDIAHATAFLLSDKSRWISGQNLIMDGGRY